MTVQTKTEALEKADTQTEITPPAKRKRSRALLIGASLIALRKAEARADALDRQGKN